MSLRTPKNETNLLDQSVPYNERELLDQVAQGSETAFGKLFDRYERLVFSYALKITGSHEISEDLVQDVFVQVWNIRARLQDIENFNAYIHKMAYHAAYKSLQQVAREKLLLKQLKEETGISETGPSKQLLSKEVRQQIQKLVDQLTPKQRQVFLLSREEGLKQEEIAARLGIGLATVKTHINDALRFLREGLGGQYGSQAIIIVIIWQLENL